MINQVPTIGDVLSFWADLKRKNRMWDTRHPYPWEDEEKEMIRFLRAITGGNSDWLVFLDNSTIADTYVEPITPDDHLAYAPINFMTRFALDVSCKFNKAELSEVQSIMGLRDIHDISLTEYLGFRTFWGDRDSYEKVKIGRIPAVLTIPYVRVRELEGCEDWVKKLAIEARNDFVRDYFSERKSIQMTRANLPEVMVEKLESICNPFHWIAIEHAGDTERRLVRENRLAAGTKVEITQPSFSF
jgi:hypothetical protein